MRSTESFICCQPRPEINTLHLNYSQHHDCKHETHQQQKSHGNEKEYNVVSIFEKLRVSEPELRIGYEFVIVKDVEYDDVYAFAQDHKELQLLNYDICQIQIMIV